MQYSFEFQFDVYLVQKYLLLIRRLRRKKLHSKISRWRWNLQLKMHLMHPFSLKLGK